MAQTWEDLLFAHWPVAADALRELVPARLAIDECDGSAWLGITAFRISGLRLRGTLPFRWVSSFLELNVRMYVTAEGKPGIWFFSLDAGSPLAVEAARRLYKLPYFRARMSAARRGGGWIDYASARRDGGPPAVFSARYRPAGDVFEARPGSLEEFLTERYCLYAAEGKRLFRAEIHHPRWRLQEAEAEIELNTMAPQGLKLPRGKPLLHFSRRQDALVWPLEPLDGARSRQAKPGSASA